MSDPFIGEIQAFAFGYAPDKWLPCDGRTLPIQQFTPLFALIGNSYGGNGTTTFALPDLVGRVAVSQGQGPGLTMRVIGEELGETDVTLATAGMASHTHTLQLGKRDAADPTAGPTAVSNVAIDPSFNGFVPGPSTTTLAPSAMTFNGGSGSHANTQPTLALIYCICIEGVFPSFG